MHPKQVHSLSHILGSSSSFIVDELNLSYIHWHFLSELFNDFSCKPSDRAFWLLLKAQERRRSVIRLLYDPSLHSLILLSHYFTGKISLKPIDCSWERVTPYRHYFVDDIGTPQYDHQGRPKRNYHASDFSCKFPDVGTSFMNQTEEWQCYIKSSLQLPENRLKIYDYLFQMRQYLLKQSLPDKDISFLKKNSLKATLSHSGFVNPQSSKLSVSSRGGLAAGSGSIPKPKKLFTSQVDQLERARAKEKKHTPIIPTKMSTKVSNAFLKLLGENSRDFVSSLEKHGYTLPQLIINAFGKDPKSIANAITIIGPKYFSCHACRTLIFLSRHELRIPITKLTEIPTDEWKKLRKKPTYNRVFEKATQDMIDRLAKNVKDHCDRSILPLLYAVRRQLRKQFSRGEIGEQSVPINDNADSNNETAEHPTHIADRLNVRMESSNAFTPFNAHLIRANFTPPTAPLTESPETPIISSNISSSQVTPTSLFDINEETDVNDELVEEVIEMITVDRGVKKDRDEKTKKGGDIILQRSSVVLFNSIASLIFRYNSGSYYQQHCYLIPSFIHRICNTSISESRKIFQNLIMFASKFQIEQHISIPSDIIVLPRYKLVECVIDTMVNAVSLRQICDVHTKVDIEVHTPAALMDGKRIADAKLVIDSTECSLECEEMVVNSVIDVSAECDLWAQCVLHAYALDGMMMTCENDVSHFMEEEEEEIVFIDELMKERTVDTWEEYVLHVMALTSISTCPDNEIVFEDATSGEIEIDTGMEDDGMDTTDDKYGGKEKDDTRSKDDSGNNKERHIGERDWMEKGPYHATNSVHKAAALSDISTKSKQSMIWDPGGSQISQS